VARARRPTVEGEIFLDSGATGCAIAPAGVSIETHEAVELRDGRRAFGGYGVGVEGAGGQRGSLVESFARPAAEKRRPPSSPRISRG